MVTPVETAEASFDVIESIRKHIAQFLLNSTAAVKIKGIARK